MIEYIEGELASLTPTEAVIACHGIGYLLEISLNSFDSLRDKKNVKLLVHEIIREDAHTLYGFYSDRERQLFRLLIGVSGVGANTARTIISALQPSSLEAAIAGGDIKSLKSVKGIGAKTAERIIVDLRDKIKPAEDALVNVAPETNEAFEEALSALVMLGFQRQPSLKVLKTIFENDPHITTEKAIKQAFSLM